ncbi:lactate/malate family dehydrogenase [Streptomyces sp. NBC_00239]|uniref:lactate/malate family dehydrogenase n=1 Tax=Streptomyces sp. NBC_00239 TaxID=2903640 RepID=UPI002E282D90|nr:NAD(P)-binding domain-containing protein [Streptomyces sp. NBC_00239]
MSTQTGPVGVIGAGAVGQTVAALLVAAGWCEGVLIASGSDRSAAALVTDLQDMAQIVGSPVRAQTAQPADMRGCAAVVVAPRAKFTNTATADVRMAGLEANAPLIAALARSLTGYEGTAVVVTNPVDPLTWLFARASGAARVYGVGSATDTARYRLALAAELAVPVGSVSGHVIGEHGDAAVLCTSTTRVDGHHVRVPVRAVRAELGARPRRINAGIGRGRCGPAGAVLHALTHALGLKDGPVELSVDHDGAQLGLPVHFTAGRPAVRLPRLDPAERRLLAAADHKIHLACKTISHHFEGAR